MRADKRTVAQNPFVGVWSLDRFTERSNSSEESNPLGIDPVGFLIYTADGYVSAQLMRSNRDPLKTDPWEAGASAEGADLTKGYIAYCGRYEVNEEKSGIIHLPLVALLPNLINHEQHRTFKFEDDTLTLVTMRRRSNGSVVDSTLIWRRCPMESSSSTAIH
jgi:hypothetical protein